MQSNHDRSIDPDLYRRARALILDDVMVATSHAPVDSTALAIDAVARKLDDTPWTMWDELGLIVLTLKPVDARVSLDEYGDATTMWVSKHESAQRIREANHGLSWTTVIVNPYEIIQSVEAQHPAVIDLTDEGTPDLVTNGGVVLDWKTIPADAGHRAGSCGWDDLLSAVSEEPRPRRNRRRLVELVVLVVVAAVVFFAAARQAGAATPISCSLHVIEQTTEAIVWGYTPPDNVLRGLFLPSGAWVALEIGGRTRTPIVTEIAYPRSTDRIVVADLIAECNESPATTVPPTTVAPTTTTSATAAPTTTTTQPEPTTTTTGQATTTTAALSTGSTISSSTSWVPTTTAVEPPVLTTLATTPLPPATVATPPATTASVPPSTSTTPGLVGGELPRTGPSTLARMAWTGGLLMAAGAVLALIFARNSKES